MSFPAGKNTKRNCQGDIKMLLLVRFNDSITKPHDNSRLLIYYILTILHIALGTK